MVSQRPRLRVIARSKAPAVRGSASATDRIVESITGAIVERRLNPGTKLVEQGIADIFKVSRTVVRQALNQLSRDRLVTLEPARGAFVAMPSIEEARQVFEMRNMLETAMVRQLCARVTDAQVAQLRAHLREERQSVTHGDVALRTRLLAEFHVILAQLLGNHVLAEALRDLLNRSQLISLMFQSSHSADESQREHEQVVDAIERRDARAATRLMESHINSVERNLKTSPDGTELAQILRVPE
ncbi:MAG: GntR family transcriptional regulator [Rubrivivax sp.]